LIKSRTRGRGNRHRGGTRSEKTIGKEIRQAEKEVQVASDDQKKRPRKFTAKGRHKESLVSPANWNAMENEGKSIANKLRLRGDGLTNWGTFQVQTQKGNR